MILSNMKKSLITATIMLLCLALTAGCSDFLDILLKTIRITSPEDGVVSRYDQISISVSWSDPEISTISCQSYFYNVKGGETSHTFYSISLFQGWNTIWVYASGRGISCSDNIDVYYDPYPPNLLIIGPTNNSEVSSSNVTIHGTVSDNYGLQSIYYKGDQGHYGTVPFSEGQWYLFVKDLKNNTKYTFKVMAVDHAGWIAQETVNFTCKF
jgi:hypothetical protein